ncbi:hypothetical protein GCM10022232_76650 [Streptomyces plumbiresistens]|uniref:Uncharacterized protein n=1 Tax=Streptomyces plumbiresistens TaxID=511811 RepID=A0ABP7T5U7_9ACTN
MVSPSRATARAAKNSVKSRDQSDREPFGDAAPVAPTPPIISQRTPRPPALPVPRPSVGAGAPSAPAPTFASDHGTRH